MCAWKYGDWSGDVAREMGWHLSRCFNGRVHDTKGRLIYSLFNAITKCRFTTGIRQFRELCASSLAPNPRLQLLTARISSGQPKYLEPPLRILSFHRFAKNGANIHESQYTLLSDRGEIIVIVSSGIVYYFYMVVRVQDRLSGDGYIAKT